MAVGHNNNNNGNGNGNGNGGGNGGGGTNANAGGGGGNNAGNGQGNGNNNNHSNNAGGGGGQGNNAGGGGNGGGSNAGGGGNGGGQGNNSGNGNNAGNGNNNNHNSGNGGGGNNGNGNNAGISGSEHPQAVLGNGGAGNSSGGVSAPGGNGNGNGNQNSGNNNAGDNKHPNSGGTSAPEAGTGPLHSGNGGGGVAAGNGNGGNASAGNGNNGNNHNGNNAGNKGGAGGGSGANGGTTYQIPVSSWTNNYQAWLKEHPHPGNSPGAKSGQYPGGMQQWNADYHAWLQQHPNPGGNASAGNGKQHTNQSNGPSIPGIAVNPDGTTTPVTIGPDGTTPRGNNQHGNSGGHHQSQPGGVDLGGPPPYATPIFGPDSPGTQGATDTTIPPSTVFNPADNTDPLIPSGATNIDGVQVLGGTADSSTTSSGPLGNTGAPASQYIVQAGDSLAAIADAHGMQLSQLESLNPQIEHPNLIFTGQAVNLGSGGDPAPQSAVGFGTAPAGGFPTSSTYPPAEDDSTQELERQAGNKFKNFRNKLKGWGTGNPPADPAQSAMYMNDQTDTNPTTIKDNKNRGPHNG